MELSVRESREEEARRITVSFDPGTKLDEMVSNFGPEVVYNAAVDALTQDLRTMVRARLKAGEDEATIHEAVRVWTPGARGSDPELARLHRLLDKLPAAKQAELRERLQSREL